MVCPANTGTTVHKHMGHIRVSLKVMTIIQMNKKNTIKINKHLLNVLTFTVQIADKLQSIMGTTRPKEM